MPRPDFLPRRDAELDAWARNFVARVSTDPGRYGVSPAEADELVTRAADFDAALTAATNPVTRTRPAVTRKNAARRALAAWVRPLARRIQALRGTDDRVRADLRLSVAGELRTAAVAVAAGPVSRPVLSAWPMTGRRVRLRLRDEGAPDRRGKPRGVVGALLFARPAGSGNGRATGAEQYVGILTRGLETIELPALEAGGADDRVTRVRLTARWFDGRGREGPASLPAEASVIP